MLYSETNIETAHTQNKTGIFARSEFMKRNMTDTKLKNTNQREILRKLPDTYVLFFPYILDDILLIWCKNILLRKNEFL